MHLKKQERIGLLASVWLFEHCTSRELDALQRVATGLDVPPARCSPGKAKPAASSS